jgi:hypothetical protein
MHQTHNIAWDSLTANLTFISENPAITPRRTDLFPRCLASQANSLNHFARTVATTIREFSDTEHAKYPTHYDAPLHGKLFSDTILSRHSGLYFGSVTPKNQLIENWIDRARSERSYKSGEDLGDVVKVLLVENELDTLLMLAHHPQVPLADLHSFMGPWLGWDHIMDLALEAYIFFNVLLSKPELHAGGRYKSMRSYQHVCELTGDYVAQSFPHHEFFWGTAGREGVADGMDSINPLGDLNKLHEYLKVCFRLLYQYDMLARECGRSVDWERNVTHTVAYLWRVKVDYNYMKDEKGNWVSRFV